MKRLACALLAAAVLAGCRPAPTADQPAESPVVPAPSGQPPSDSVGVEARAVSVYFPDSGLQRLEAESVDVPDSGGDPSVLAEGALAALLTGPSEPAHARIVPEGTELRSVKVTDGTAVVDLSKDFVDRFSGGSDPAALAVYSIVNTLTELPGVEQVKLLIDGQPGGDFAGVIDLNQPLKKDPALIGSQPL